MIKKILSRMGSKSIGIILLLLIALSTIAAVKLGSVSQDIRKKAAERKEEANIGKSIEVKEVSLAGNANTDIRLPLKNSKIKLNFPKGTLDKEKTKTSKVKATLIQATPHDTDIFKMDVNIIDSSISDPKNLQKITTNIPFSDEAINNKKDEYLLTYDFSELSEIYSPSSITFITSNPKTGEREVLPSQIDMQNSTITVRLKHFSLIEAKAQKAQVFAPTLKNWEANLYTGAVTYSTSIDAVPGIGGLSPDMTISYNSNLANASGQDQKGGWLGPGWSLTVPEIRFDEYKEEGSNNCDPAGTDTIAGTRNRGPQFSLILGGAENQLVWFGDSADTVGSYGKFASKQSNLTIKGYYGTYLGNTTFGSACRNKIITKWIVQDTSGIIYTFDSGTANSIADRKIKDKFVPSRYMVTEVKDLSGNRMTFGYQNETANNHIIYTYPQYIYYNYTNGNPKGAVSFEIGPKTYVPKLGAIYGEEIKYEEVNYETKRLNSVKTYSDWPAKTVYSSYFFVYDTTSYQYNYYDDKSGNTTDGFDTLSSINKFQGDNSSGANPSANQFVPETFKYELRSVGVRYHVATLYKQYCCDNTGCSDCFCEVPWPHAASIPQSYTWGTLADVFINKQPAFSETDPNYHKALCEHSRLTLVFSGLGDCKGDVGLGNGPPDQPGTNCPKITNARVQDDYVIFAWDRARAPFINIIKNSYGGRIDFSYKNIANTYEENPTNRNVVTFKEVFDENNPNLPHLYKEYSYDKSPGSVRLMPNAGGGFSRVNEKDPVTGITTSTYFYPLAAEFDSGSGHKSKIKPEKNPYFGAPLRTVVHKTTGANDNIYSDVFYTYNFVPVYNPKFGLDFPAGSADTKIINNLLDEGVGSRVTTVVDSFVPNSADFYTATLDSNNPQKIDYNDSAIQGKTLHSQTRTWYDRYGYPIKTASYGNVAGFQTGLNFDLYNIRQIATDDEAQQSWYLSSNTGLFTYGLSMGTPYLFLKGGSNTTPASGTPGSLKKFSYVNYQRSDAYLQNNITGLASESFTSEVDASDISAITDNTQKYGWAQNFYDEGISPPKGLLTSSKKINTKTSPDMLRDASGNIYTPSEIKTKTEYNSYGVPVKQYDSNSQSGIAGNISETIYFAEGKPYDNILPKEVITKDNKSGKVLSDVYTAYDDIFWMPVTTADKLNNISSKISYDCLGRLQQTYKPDPISGQPQANPTDTYFYYDYQGAGCGLGVVRLAGSSTPPLPHLRTKTRISSTNSDGTEKSDNYTYTDSISDGLGNNLQNQILKTKVEGVDKSLITETGYNNRGLKEFETLPYVSNPISASDASPLPQYKPLGYYAQLSATSNSISQDRNTRYSASLYSPDKMNSYTKIDSYDFVNNFSTLLSKIIRPQPVYSAGECSPEKLIMSINNFSTPSNSIISNLTVSDTNNASDWSTQVNLQNGNTQYGDRAYTLSSVPAIVAGADWIRTANDSKTYTGTTLTSFQLNVNATIYIAHNDEISGKPSWLSGWTDTGANIVNSEPKTFSLFSKQFTAGSTISLGNNGNTGSSLYTIIVKADAASSSNIDVTVDLGHYLSFKMEGNQGSTWQNTYFCKGIGPSMTCGSSVYNGGPTEGLECVPQDLWGGWPKNWTCKAVTAGNYTWKHTWKTSETGLVCSKTMTYAITTPTYYSDIKKTTYTYDELGRTTVVTDPLGYMTRTDYAGMETYTTDAENIGKTNPVQTVTKVDGFGRTEWTRITNINDSSDNTCLYNYENIYYYDILDNVTKNEHYKYPSALINGQGTCSGNRILLLSSFTSFDSLGRKYMVTDPDMGTWKYAYDPNGNIIRQVDAKNQTIKLTYDGAGRLTKKEYLDTSSGNLANPRGTLPVVRNFIENVYDTDGTSTFYGKKVAMNDPTGSTQYFYDKRGRPIKDIKTVDKTIAGLSGQETTTTAYEYFDSDTPKTTILDAGSPDKEERITQELNEVGLLTGTKLEKPPVLYCPSGATDCFYQQVAPLSLLSNQIYSKWGGPSKESIGNGLTAGNSYDSIGRLSEIYVRNSAGNNLMDYLYTRGDNVGNITNIKNPPSSLDLSFTYDRLYQLSNASGTYNASYVYDVLGNMTSKTEGANPAVAMGYTDPSHKHAPKVVNGFTYQYDTNGNLTEDEARTYLWDYDNKPVKITMKKDGSYTEFAYDGDGNRVMKREISATTNPTPTITPSATPTRTPSPSITAGPTVTKTPTPSITITLAPSNTPAATSPPSSCPNTCQAKGDTDCNGIVDITDYNAWKNQFTGIYTSKTADFNCDWKVDEADYGILSYAYSRLNATTPQPTNTYTPPSATKTPLTNTPVPNQPPAISATPGICLGYGAKCKLPAQCCSGVCTGGTNNKRCR